MEGMRDLIRLKKGMCEVTLPGGGIKIISWKTNKKEVGRGEKQRERSLELEQRMKRESKCI